MNVIVVDGHMVAQPDLKFTNNNKTVGNFTIGNNEGYGEKKKASFFDCVCFGKTAENVAKYCDKGSHVIINGTLQQETWTNKEGQKRSTIKIICNNIQFLDSKKENSGEQKDGTSKYNAYREMENPWGNNDNEIPF